MWILSCCTFTLPFAEKERNRNRSAELRKRSQLPRPAANSWATLTSATFERPKLTNALRIFDPSSNHFVVCRPKRISAVLNDRKINGAARGGKWQATQVIRLLHRLDVALA